MPAYASKNNRLLGKNVETAYAQRLVDLTGDKAYSADELTSDPHSPVKQAIDVAATIGTTAPVNAVTASLTTGEADAGITWTAAASGTTGNAITVVTTDAADSAVTLVTESGNAITVTRAAKARMDVTGTLTSDGSTPVSFETLFRVVDSGGKPSYTNLAGDLLIWSTGKWILQHLSPEAIWHSADDVATPDLVTTWTPQLTADGTPTVTPLSSSAVQVHAAASSLTVATSALVGTGGDSFDSVTLAQSLTGGVDATETPPFVRAADGVLYVNDNGTWKQADLSALS